MSQNTFWHNEIRGSCSRYDILFCCNVAAVLHSRQLHVYRRSAQGPLATSGTQEVSRLATIVI